MTMKALIDKTLEPYYLKLKPLLESKKRGEVLGDDEVLEKCGQPWTRMEGRIRRFFLSKGIEIRHRPKPVNGFEILTYLQQSVESVPWHVQRSQGAARRAVRAWTGVDPADFDEKQLKTHEHLGDVADKVFKSTHNARAQCQFALDGKAPTKTIE